MVLMIIAGVALVGFVSSLLYLVHFAWVSRRDTLFAPADRVSLRLARRVSGMYVRTYAGGSKQLTHR